MATNDKKKILNAIRLHLVLLNVANEASQVKMTEIIQTRNPTHSSTSVKEFLIEKYNANTNRTPFYLKGFIETLNEKYGINNTSSFY